MSTSANRFFIDWKVTHPGTAAEGLLLNSRMVQAIFDDENPATVGRNAYPDTGKWSAERNVREFLSDLPTYAEHGLRAVTVSLQGGSPGWTSGNHQAGIVTAFNSNGTLKPAWLDRLDRVIRAADQHGVAVIVSLFYFGQDHRLADEAAVLRAVDGTIDWLVGKGYTNVLVEINNEADLYYDHAILKPTRVAELIIRARERSGGLLKVSTSLKGGSIPSATLIAASDFILLHGNSQSSSGVASMVDTVRSLTAYKSNPKPIIFNEDSTKMGNFDAAVGRRASWGYYDQGHNNYVDGFQSLPVNWTINTSRKRAFFDRVTAFTGTDVQPSDPAPPSGDVAVSSFSLINADTNLPIAGFEAMTGDQAISLDLSRLPTRNLNLRANTSPATVGSVVFGLNGNASYAVENVAPYALAGDNNGNYAPWKLRTGTHTTTATSYSATNAGGSAGPAVNLTITITDGSDSPPPPDSVAPSDPAAPSGDLVVSSFSLINADTNLPIAGFEAVAGGQAISVNLSQLPTRNLNLRANTSPAIVGSV
ncbi:MAG: hypothetical protein H0X67_08655, partial [Acidobacteria bacterium]|nr:hypothetical protein [Acidobacteriota bacterium]